MRQAKQSDAFDVIGVRQDATTLEIKRAFRERAKETHPDLNAGRQAQDDFVRLVAAYRATEAGAMRNVPAASPVARRVGSIPTLLMAKGTLLLMGALGLAFYIQSDLTSENPATPAGTSRELLQGPRNVEPVWNMGTVDRSVLAGGFGHKAGPGITLVRAMPEVPNLLRAGSANGPLEIVRTSASPATKPVRMKPSASVKVMPPRRPRYPGPAKKPRVAKAKQKEIRPVAPVRTAARRASPLVKPAASPLELLFGLQ